MFWKAKTSPGKITTASDHVAPVRTTPAGEEALKWFRRAAEQNDAAAQTNLGVMYDFGHGVVRDYAEALKWYRKAADHGDAEARYNLGVIYERGDGVPQNYP
jgi:TPR repeat protein